MFLYSRRNDASIERAVFNDNLLYEAWLQRFNHQLGEVALSEDWIDGETVYKSIVAFGALPNATTKTVAHSISTLARVVDYAIVADNGTSQIKFVFGGEPSALINDTNISITATGDFSGYTTAHALICYTKT